MYICLGSGGLEVNRKILLLLGPMSSSSPLVDERSQSGIESAMGWIGGIIIGAVLATVTLFILWITVWMIRRRQQLLHKLVEQDQR